jgi:hypothetical protein
MDCNTKIATASFATRSIGARRNGHCRSTHATNTDVLKRHHHETAPNRQAAQLVQGECRALGYSNLAAADGLLQQTTDNRRFSGSRLGRKRRS